MTGKIMNSGSRWKLEELGGSASEQDQAIEWRTAAHDDFIGTLLQEAEERGVELHIVGDELVFSCDQGAAELLIAFARQKVAISHPDADDLRVLAEEAWCRALRSMASLAAKHDRLPDFEAILDRIPRRLVQAALSAKVSRHEESSQ
jgi:hypothetical protein